MKLLKLILLSIIFMTPSHGSADTFNQSTPPKAGSTVATIKTSKGTIKAVIFTDVVPNAAKNFVELANQGKYNGSPFHRIIKDFMIQGGDFTKGDGTGGHAAKGPGNTIGDEYSPKLSHIYGALSWAKTSAPNSIGSQFFIVNAKKGTHFLDHPPGGSAAQGYSVFGQAYEGFDVIDAISGVETDGTDHPKSPITIESITVQTLK